MVELAEEFGERLREELDYRIEARNALEIATNLPPDSPVRVPRVYAELTTPRVLVMEWLDGRTLFQHIAALAFLGLEDAVIVPRLGHINSPLLPPNSPCAHRKLLARGWLPSGKRKT